MKKILTTLTTGDNKGTILIQHERKAIRHETAWSGGERVCYTQRIDVERDGCLIRSEEARFWHYPNGQLVRMELVELSAALTQEIA